MKTKYKIISESPINITRTANTCHYIAKCSDFWSNLFLELDAHPDLTTEWASQSEMKCSIRLRNDVIVPISIGKFQRVSQLDYAPVINCQAAWLNRNIDWHVYKKGNLCWVFPPEWTLYIQLWYTRNQYSIEQLAHCGAHWLVRNTEHLLNAHWIGLEENIPDWLPEWGGYVHGRKAAMQQLRLNMARHQNIIAA